MLDDILPLLRDERFKRASGQSLGCTLNPYNPTTCHTFSAEQDFYRYEVPALAGVAQKRALFRVFLQTLRDPNLTGEHKASFRPPALEIVVTQLTHGPDRLLFIFLVFSAIVVLLVLLVSLVLLVLISVTCEGSS